MSERGDYCQICVYDAEESRGDRWLEIVYQGTDQFSN